MQHVLKIFYLFAIIILTGCGGSSKESVLNISAGNNQVEYEGATIVLRSSVSGETGGY